MPNKKKNSGLGRGLNALIVEANHETGGAKADNTIAIDSIITNPDQPRKSFDPSALQELADSIKKNGILQPLLVRKKGDKYEIVAGERRYQAAKLAELTKLPVIVREVSDKEIMQLALIENLQRSDLNPIEEAKGFKVIIEQDGLTQEQLAQVLSKSRSAITNTLRLLDLPAEVQDMMIDGLLSAGHARAILAVPSEEGRIKLAQKVVESKLSVRETEKLAPLFSGTDDAQIHVPKKEKLPATYKKVARQLRMTLDRNVKVKQVRGKNKLEIEFQDEDDLGILLQQFGFNEFGA